MQTFKDYLNSKKCLQEAVKRTPSQTITYSIINYCRITLVEDTGEKRIIPLKPKQRLSVRWIYEDITSPSALEIRLDGVKNVDSTNLYISTWKNTKLIDWLDKNTIEMD